ncbi:MAG: AbrB family transcriptional regulator [Thaumarchaeota archaeon]|nr:AbrB family transcriptional regulator [Nitrososphaerota archaeon]
MPETDVTKLVTANISKSLRSTVPAYIVRQFELKEGDRIKWELKVVDGEMAIFVTPIKEP